MKNLSKGMRGVKKEIESLEELLFELKEKLRKYYEGKGLLISDFGPYEYNEQDDYPDLIIPAASYLSKHIDTYRGVFFCGTGGGAMIAANKMRGIRAMIGVNEKVIEDARKHNDINVLALGQENTSFTAWSVPIVASSRNAPSVSTNAGDGRFVLLSNVAFASIDHGFCG